MTRVTKHKLTAVDARGSITNVIALPADANPVRGVAMIDCRPGSTRSVHYHKTDGHWLFVVHGKMLYYERPVGSTDWGTPITVMPDQSIYTPPMVEHKTVFPIRTMILSLSHNARTHAEHEADLVRVEP